MAPAILPLFAASHFIPVLYSSLCSFPESLGLGDSRLPAPRWHVMSAWPNTSDTRAESLATARCALTSSPTGMSWGLIASEMPLKGKHRKAASSRALGIRPVLQDGAGWARRGTDQFCWYIVGMILGRKPCAYMLCILRVIICDQSPNGKIGLSPHIVKHQYHSEKARVTAKKKKALPFPFPHDYSIFSVSTTSRPGGIPLVK